MTYVLFSSHSSFTVKSDQATATNSSSCYSLHQDLQSEHRLFARKLCWTVLTMHGLRLSSLLCFFTAILKVLVLICVYFHRQLCVTNLNWWFHRSGISEVGCQIFTIVPRVCAPLQKRFPVHDLNRYHCFLFQSYSGNARKNVNCRFGLCEGWSTVVYFAFEYYFALNMDTFA